MDADATATGRDSSGDDATTGSSVCGDGQIEGDEVCDDGAGPSTGRSAPPMAPRTSRSGRTIRFVAGAVTSAANQDAYVCKLTP